MFLLRLVIPTPTPVSLPEVFLRPAVDVGYPVAAVVASVAPLPGSCVCARCNDRHETS